MSRENTISSRHSAVITLPSDTEIVITRVFDAPADLIFKAWTTPEWALRSALGAGAGAERIR